MTRRALFEAIRPFAPSQRFTQNQVTMIDALATSFGFPADGEPPLARGMTASQKAIDLMHEFESCKLTAYPDPGSKNGLPWTIGWGSTGPDIVKGTVWTQAQADARFARDLAKFSKTVSDAIGPTITTQNQFDAMVSLAYNIGAEAFKGSTLLKKHKAGDPAGAQAEFKKWVYNDGKKLAGLVRRRDAEAALYGSK